MIAIVIVLSIVWVFIVILVIRKYGKEYGHPFKSKLIWAMIIAVVTLIVIMIRETLAQL